MIHSKSGLSFFFFVIFSCFALGFSLKPSSKVGLAFVAECKDANPGSVNVIAYCPKCRFDKNPKLGGVICGKEGDCKEFIVTGDALVNLDDGIYSLGYVDELVGALQPVQNKFSYELFYTQEGAKSVESGLKTAEIICQAKDDDSEEDFQYPEPAGFSVNDGISDESKFTPPTAKVVYKSNIEKVTDDDNDEQFIGVDDVEEFVDEDDDDDDVDDDTGFLPSNVKTEDMDEDNEDDGYEIFEDEDDDEIVEDEENYEIFEGENDDEYNEDDDDDEFVEEDDDDEFDEEDDDDEFDEEDDDDEYDEEDDDDKIVEDEEDYEIFEGENDDEIIEDDDDDEFVEEDDDDEFDEEDDDDEFDEEDDDDEFDDEDDNKYGEGVKLSSSRAGDANIDILLPICPTSTGKLDAQLSFSCPECDEKKLVSLVSEFCDGSGKCLSKSVKPEELASSNEWTFDSILTQNPSIELVEDIPYKYRTIYWFQGETTPRATPLKSQSLSCKEVLPSSASQNTEEKQNITLKVPKTGSTISTIIIGVAAVAGVSMLSAALVVVIRRRKAKKAQEVNESFVMMSPLA